MRFHFAPLIVLIAALHGMSNSAALATEQGADDVGLSQSAGELQLIGWVVRGREVAALQVWKVGTEYYIDLADFAATLDVQVVERDGRVSVVTPLGSVDVPANLVMRFEGRPHVSHVVLPRYLASPVEFRVADYSLAVDPAWTAPQSGALPSALMPDVRAPGFSVSRLDGVLSATDVGNDGTMRLDADLSGAAADGLWQARLRSSEDSTSLDDYFWLRRSGDSLWFAGNQRVALHPLAQSFEFTGVEYSRSPRLGSLFSAFGADRLTVRRDQRAVRDFRGQGPAGGIAELRVEGVAIARVQIGLDSRYEFVDVELSSRGYQSIEVFLYERGRGGSPVSVDDFSQTVSQIVLPKGTWYGSVGAGVAGNPLSDVDGGSRDMSAFGQYRYGITDRLTWEASVQSDGQQSGALTGLSLSLGEHWSVAAAVGGGDAASGHYAEFAGGGDRWRALVSSRQRDGIVRDGSDDGKDLVRRADFRYRLAPNFTAGLVGRQTRGTGLDTSFLKPSLTWQPKRSLSLSAFPDATGLYRYDLDWAPTYGARVGLSRGVAGDFLDATMRLNDRWLLRGIAQRADSGIDRQELGFTRYGSGAWGSSIDFGVSRTRGKTGVFLDALFNVLPGIRARVEVRDRPLLTGFSQDIDDRLVNVSIFGNFTVAGRRLMPARTTRLTDTRGAIAGHVEIDAPEDMQDWDLSKVGILVDGAPRGTPGPGGTFYVGYLESGVHQIKLDDEHLPIELRTLTPSVNVEVKGATVTSVVFRVAPSFGFAGRVIDAAGEPVAGLSLRIEGVESSTVTEVVTDANGYYRVDGLPVDKYSVARSDQADAADSALLTIARLDDFLFDQDVYLPSE